MPFSGVNMMNGKYMVEIPRKYTGAKELLETQLPKCVLENMIDLSIKKEYRVLENEQIFCLFNLIEIP